MSAPARIAIVGWGLESNRHAEVADQTWFAERALYWGAEAWRDDGVRRRYAPDGDLAFGAALSRCRAWQAVPIVYADGFAGGPCDEGFFRRSLVEIERRLHAAGRLDGVLIAGHGAGLTTASEDLDGPLYALVRHVVGASVPIVAVLDLHANVSDAMFDAVDVAIAYRTNPHVDQDERYAEAAVLLDRLLRGERLHAAMVRIPLVTPQVTQRTAPDQPLGQLYAAALATPDPGLVNVGLLPGFAFGDTSYNGFCVLATSAVDAAHAAAHAERIATDVWALREAFTPRLLSIEAAARLATAPGARRLAFADVGDNPGGGGTGDTTALLKALHLAGARDVQLGVHCDAGLARAAHAAGAGRTLRVAFDHPLDGAAYPRLEVEARVLATGEGAFTGRLGMARDYEVRLGPCAALEFDGLALAVISIRQQILSPEYLAAAGLRPEAARGYALKSRGHFRAGFGGLVEAADIHEVDTPGLTTANLASVPWRALHVGRYPFERSLAWTPRESLRLRSSFGR